VREAGALKQAGGDRGPVSGRAVDHNGAIVSNAILPRRVAASTSRPGLGDQDDRLLLIEDRSAPRSCRPPPR
jgi:hypothetical protein